MKFDHSGSCIINQPIYDINVLLFQVWYLFLQGIQGLHTALEISTRESAEACGSGTQEVGDWRDCISDRTALFWAVYADEWGRLLIRILCILWSNTESGIFQGRIASGSQSC